MGKKRVNYRHLDDAAQARKKQRHNKSPFVSSGMRGIFISCQSNRQREAVQEMNSYLKGVVDRMYPDRHSIYNKSDDELDQITSSSAAATIEAKEVASTGSVSIADELEAELAELRNDQHNSNPNNIRDNVEGKSKKTDFRIISVLPHSGNKGGHFFVQLVHPRLDPIEITEYIVDQALKEGAWTRFVSTWIPITSVFRTNEEDLLTNVKELLDAEMESVTEEHSFTIKYKKRGANDAVKHDRIMPQLREMLPANSKFTWKKADIALIIQVFGGFIGIGLYKAYATFNDFSLSKLNERQARQETKEMKTNTQSSG